MHEVQNHDMSKPPLYKVKTLVGLSIPIIALGLVGVASEPKQHNSFKTLIETKPYINDHQTLAPILKTKNGDNFILPYNHSMQDSINEVSRVSEDFGEDGPLSRRIKDLDKSLQSATESCRELLSLALYNLNLSSMPTHSSIPTPETLEDFKTLLCATLADIETCLYGFENALEEAQKIVIASLDGSKRNVSHSISILDKIDHHDPSRFGSRKLRNNDWMSSKEWKLVLDSNEKIDVDVVVAKDGTGKYQTINEAINAAPESSAERFVIYVKEGVYYENVKIDMNKWNIMMFGDGMNKTIVTGNLSQASGQSILESATFGVHGRGFIARDMGFENTAGPSMGQALAFLSSSDKSIVYNCSIRAYQDTLFALSNRHFYRQTLISGTIDFIFGTSSAVFQNCTILVRRPLLGQSNAITAQGRSDPRCPSGFSIHNSAVVASEDLAGARTFLGRPWKSFSTTAFMKSFLDSLIDPAGWLEWRPNVTPPETIFYGEYGNWGGGAATEGRVAWKGVREKMSVKEAEGFTVREFINGVEWIPASGVPFKPDL